MNNQSLGETAPMTYFYKEIEPGSHQISTESEFGYNHLTLETEAGRNYFVRQYIKMGVFVGGSNLEVVSEERAKKDILECQLAKESPVAPRKKKKLSSDNDLVTCNL